MAELTQTTSINDLPTDPTSGGSVGGNVTLNVTETTGHIPPVIEPPKADGILDPNTISQLVSGVQQASTSGATQLPSRDIPQMTEQLTRDAEIQPNYVPPPEHQDYIQDSDENINNYYQQETTNNSIDTLYDEIQTPLLLAILYFLFQLPITKQLIGKYMTFLCHKDGNYNIYGLSFVCMIFGLTFYSISKSITHFSKF